MEGKKYINAKFNTGKHYKVLIMTLTLAYNQC